MITTWSQGDARGGMDAAILVDLAELVARHPWWAARGRLLRCLLQRLGCKAGCRILDVGCGWGTNLAALEQAGYAVTGLDASRPALDRLDRPGRNLIEADLSQDLPAATPDYDVVLALDVIEHVDDDAALIRRLAQLVCPQGRVIVSVPAMPELFSEFDRVQGHRRRYTPLTLREAIVAGGLEVEQLLWWGQWMTGLLGRRRNASRARPGDGNAEIYRRYLSLPPWPGVWLLRLLFHIDQRRMLEGRNARGTSLFAVAVRR